jgi:hypothetical protein
VAPRRRRWELFFERKRRIGRKKIRILKKVFLWLRYAVQLTVYIIKDIPKEIRLEYTRRITAEVVKRKGLKIPLQYLMPIMIRVFKTAGIRPVLEYRTAHSAAAVPNIKIAFQYLMQMKARMAGVISKAKMPKYSTSIQIKVNRGRVLNFVYSLSKRIIVWKRRIPAPRLSYRTDASIWVMKGRPIEVFDSYENRMWVEVEKTFKEDAGTK